MIQILTYEIMLYFYTLTCDVILYFICVPAKSFYILCEIILFYILTCETIFILYTYRRSMMYTYLRKYFTLISGTMSGVPSSNRRHPGVLLALKKKKNIIISLAILYIYTVR